MVRYSTDGGIHASSLAELAVMQYNLRATCRCGHSNVIDGIALWWLFERKGRDQSLRAVGRYLVCGVCLHSNRKRVRWPKVEPAREHGAMCGLPCPGKAEWKRLVARYRT